MNGTEAFEILRRVEDRWIRAAHHRAAPTAQLSARRRVKGRAVVIPRFKTIELFVYNYDGHWICSESLWGTSCGYGRTAQRAVESTIRSLDFHGIKGDKQLKKVFAGWPLLSTLPIYNPARGEGE